MDPNRSSRFTPLIVAFSIVIGIIIGSFYANHFSGNRLSIINTSSNKLNDLLQIIDAQYVDKVNMQDLVEKSLPKILSELDPHSTYTSAKDVEAQMQDLKGSFSGIGVQFIIIDDTIRVVATVPGGPSRAAGIAAGDCIVRIAGKNFTGKQVTNDEAMKRLKGPRGSKVELGIYRPSDRSRHTYTLTRDNIPIKSIQTAYMLDDQTGYIKVDQFADSTYPEFLVALAKLGQQGCTRLVLDLRGNHGGFVQPAVNMAAELLQNGRMIFYMEGRHSPRENYTSDGRGTHLSTPLIVLVDEETASAAEIFSGAMQDNDRAMIVGRRTFGKGLVQESIEFRDKSMLRLTIARYYMPSGRCVQKPYTPGNTEDYDMDIINRLKSGELENGDRCLCARAEHGHDVLLQGGRHERADATVCVHVRRQPPQRALPDAHLGTGGRVDQEARHRGELRHLGQPQRPAAPQPAHPQVAQTALQLPHRLHHRRYSGPRRPHALPQQRRPLCDDRPEDDGRGQGLSPSARQKCETGCQCKRQS